MMDKVSFGALNWAVLLLYLAVVLAIGARFTIRAGKSTGSFFLANGHIPTWAAGISIYATTLSAITFMGVPEEAYLTNWSYAAAVIAIIATIPLLTHFYIPFFRKLHVTTAYEYLEARFSATVRSIGSALFICFNIGRVAIIIFLPVLAITSVSNIDPVTIAVAISALCIAYTFLGGIEGVVWNDVVQGIILLAGAISIVVLGILSVHGGFATVVHDAIIKRKIVAPGDFSFSLARLSIPVIFIGSIFNSLQQYSASQDVVQRYQTTPSLQAATKSLWVNGYLSLVGIPIFFGIGTVLYSFYRHHGGLPIGVDTSAIVPYFIVTNMPSGVAGLLIVAILASCQSAASSGLNAISACVVTDFKQRFVGTSHGKGDVWLARIVIVVAGLVSSTIALHLLIAKQAETWNLFLAVMGLFGVPVAGIFALGVFTRRARALGAVIGFVCGVGTGSYVFYGTDLSPFWVSIVSFTTCFVIGYLFSLAAGGGGRDVAGLTVYDVGGDISDHALRDTRPGNAVTRTGVPLGWEDRREAPIDAGVRCGG